MSPPLPFHRRILLVDDNAAIHDDFRRILIPRHTASSLDTAAAALFGEPSTPPIAEIERFELDHASQGEEAVAKARAAVDEGRPYALAFVDMRMPPGWDGLTTIRHLWEIDPEIQTVICTAYSDRSWSEIQVALTARDQWLVLKKPFDKVEVLQLAQALTEKWKLMRLSRIHLATLEERVRERTAQLQNAMQAKQEFLANLTHELLTPMNGILGMLSLVRDTPLAPDQASCLADAQGCAERLNQLLGQILAYNEAESGRLELTTAPFAPAALLGEICAAFGDRARVRGVALTPRIDAAVPATVQAPVAIVRELLLALVDNAVKFTQHGAIEVSVGREGPGLVFSVRDTGPGLTPAQLAWISMPFAQVDGQLNRRGTGFGIGLTLAKRLAQALGGELRLVSRAGEGTSVSFTVAPVAPRADG